VHNHKLLRSIYYGEARSDEGALAPI
jgi:hypothetical protein